MSFISFLHLPRSTASSLFNLHAWQSFAQPPSQSSLVCLWVTSYSVPFFTQSLSCLYHHNLFCCSTEITSLVLIHAWHIQMLISLTCLLCSITVYIIDFQAPLTQHCKQWIHNTSILTKLDTVWLLSTAGGAALTVVTGTGSVTDTSLTSTLSLATSTVDKSADTLVIASHGGVT